VPAGKLTIARPRQTTVENWQRPGARAPVVRDPVVRDPVKSKK
jgi:hypothetical protein